MKGSETDMVGHASHSLPEFARVCQNLPKFALHAGLKFMRNVYLHTLHNTALMSNSLMYTFQGGG